MGSEIKKAETAAQTEATKNNVAADANNTEIDLVDMMYYLLAKWQYIVMWFFLGAVLLNAYAYFCIEPTFVSTSKLYIVSASEDSIVNLTDLNIGTSLTKDYEELIFSYSVFDQVIDRLELDTTYDKLKEKVSLVNPSDSRVLEITVTTTDRELSRDIANTLAEVAIEYLPETMSTHAPNIAERARIAEKKAAPSYMKFTLIGALLGIIISGGFFVVKYIMDDTIHTAEDMEKYFGIIPLTSIPMSDAFDVGDTYEGHRRERRKDDGKNE